MLEVGKICSLIRRRHSSQTGTLPAPAPDLHRPRTLTSTLTYGRRTYYVDRQRWNTDYFSYQYAPLFFTDPLLYLPKCPLAFLSTHYLPTKMPLVFYRPILLPTKMPFVFYRPTILPTKMPPCVIPSVSIGTGQCHTR